jgi:hypothetical protein
MPMIPLGCLMLVATGRILMHTRPYLYIRWRLVGRRNKTSASVSVSAGERDMPMIPLGFSLATVDVFAALQCMYHTCLYVVARRAFF